MSYKSQLIERGFSEEKIFTLSQGFVGNLGGALSRAAKQARETEKAIKAGQKEKAAEGVVAIEKLMTDVMIYFETTRLMTGLR